MLPLMRERAFHPDGPVSAHRLEIRAAGMADLEALVDTRVALFRELEGLSESAEVEFRARCRDIMAQLLGDGRGVAWLAVTPEHAVQGAAFLLEFPRLPSPRNLRSREGYALSVYVTPEFRRQGVASALMAGAIAEARQRGHARIRLHATPDGRPVYERLGFKGRDDEMELVL